MATTQLARIARLLKGASSLMVIPYFSPSGSGCFQSEQHETLLVDDMTGDQPH